MIAWEKNSNFQVYHFTLENSGKAKLYAGEFYEIVLHPWEIPMPKVKIYGNSI